MDHPTIASNENRRREVLEEASKLPLPDVVFAIIHFNCHLRLFGPLPWCEPIPLSDLWPECRNVEIEAWARKVEALRGVAGDVGDSLLSGESAWDSKQRELEMAHPGFAHDTYWQVMHFGCYQAK